MKAAQFHKPLLAVLETTLVLVLSVMLFQVRALDNVGDKDVSDAANYRMNTGDKLRIQVYGEEDLSLEARVSDSGDISYPFLGVLKVIGMTPGHLAEHIAGKLRGDYLVNPKVSVDIIEYRLFFVNGEVASPGGFPFQPGITVRKAISLAGGFKERAAKDKIFIIRDGSPNDEPARASLDDKVSPGDIITVEESFF